MKLMATTIVEPSDIMKSIPGEDGHHLTDSLHPAVGVGAMIVRNGRVMLGRRKGAHGAGTYAWCGGGLEFGESLEEAITREVRQESGLIVTNTKLLCVSNIRQYGRHYVDFEFLCEADGDPVQTEPNKSEPWEWYDLDNLPQPLFKAVENAVDSYRTKRFYYQ
jgi:8-oxo-dGTP diphosphatase